MSPFFVIRVRFKGEATVQEFSIPEFCTLEINGEASLAYPNNVTRSPDALRSGGRSKLKKARAAARKARAK